MSYKSDSLVLVYDGGCVFCEAFASRAELMGGLPGLKIVDGRTDHQLRHHLQRQGFNFDNGAVLISGEQIWHGSAAIAQISALMRPSDPLLHVLKEIFKQPQRAQRVYPFLLFARRVVLGLRGLSVSP
jgi:predicted DCC family thiol-disulfide oxidoreductase YuxK